MEDLDIVYFVKDADENEELKYSLRSVEQHFPYRRVIFIGGCPKGIKPDKLIRTKQDKETKWENTNIAMRAACESKSISDNFVLFNDDFFILNDITELLYYYDGTLADRIHSLQGYSHSEYKQKLIGCRNMLISRGYTERNYAVHVPIIINKKQMLDCMKRFPQGLMWRSLYGNFINAGGENIKDPKVATTYQTLPVGNFASSNDYSFKYGVAGRQIKSRFLTPSRFESD